MNSTAQVILTVDGETVDPEKLMTGRQAADIIGVHFTNVYRMIKRGELRGIPIGGQLFLSIEEVNKLKDERAKKSKK